MLQLQPLTPLVDEFASRLFGELDYVQEGLSAEKFQVGLLFPPTQRNSFHTHLDLGLYSRASAPRMFGCTIFHFSYFVFRVYVHFYNLHHPLKSTFKP